MSKNMKRKPVHISVKTYPSELGTIKLTISVNLDDYKVGFDAGLAGEPRVPDPFILDFSGWHVGYSIGNKARSVFQSLSISLPNRSVHQVDDWDEAECF